MARGFGAAESGYRKGVIPLYKDGPFEGSPIMPQSLIDGKPIRNGIKDFEKKALVALKNKETLNTFRKLVDAVNLQQVSVTGKAVKNATKEQRQMVNEAKANKLKVAALVKKLPPAVREAIEQDRAVIDQLFRGVHNRNINETDTWKNGKFVYGFTPEAEVAERFFTKGGAMVTHKDIESFGGIIDTQLLDRLVQAYNLAQWGHAGSYDRENDRPREGAGERNPERYERWKKNRILYNNIFGEERELMVYDIKFKKTGDKYYT